MTIDQLTALITAVAADELPIWDADEGTPQQKTKKITVQDFINSIVTIADLLKKTDIYNGLDQTAAGYALDARQGKALNDIIGPLSGLQYVTNTSIVSAINSVAGRFENSNYSFVTGSISMSATSTVIQQIQAVIDDINTNSKPALFMYEVLSGYYLSIQGVLYAGKNAGSGLYYKPDGTFKYWRLLDNTIVTYTITKTAD